MVELPEIPDRYRPLIKQLQDLDEVGPAVRDVTVSMKPFRKYSSTDKIPTDELEAEFRRLYHTYALCPVFFSLCRPMVADGREAYQVNLTTMDEDGISHGLFSVYDVSMNGVLEKAIVAVALQVRTDRLDKRSARRTKKKADQNAGD